MGDEHGRVEIDVAVVCERVDNLTKRLGEYVTEDRKRGDVVQRMLVEHHRSIGILARGHEALEEKIAGIAAVKPADSVGLAAAFLKLKISHQIVTIIVALAGLAITGYAAYLKGA